MNPVIIRSSKLALLQKVWSRIDNPKSSSPDVELGSLLVVLVDVVVEAELLPDCGSAAANWALAYATLRGGAHPGDLQAAWSDKVPYYSDKQDKDGYPQPRLFKEYDKDIQTAELAMAEALQTLITKGILIKSEDNDEDKLKPVMLDGECEIKE